MADLRGDDKRLPPDSGVKPLTRGPAWLGRLAFRGALDLLAGLAAVRPRGRGDTGAGHDEGERGDRTGGAGGAGL